MKKMFFLKSFLFSMATLAGFEFAQAADSGFFIEPALTYEASGTANVNWSGNNLTGSSGNVNGYGLGLKIGSSVADIVTLGLDFNYSKPNYGSYYSTVQAESQLAGVFVGVQMPIVGLRFWGTYIPYGIFDPASDGGMDVKYTGGTGYKLGVGLHVLVLTHF